MNERALELLGRPACEEHTVKTFTALCLCHHDSCTKLLPFVTDHSGLASSNVFQNWYTAFNTSCILHMLNALKLK